MYVVNCHVHRSSFNIIALLFHFVSPLRAVFGRNLWNADSLPQITLITQINQLHSLLHTVCLLHTSYYILLTKLLSISHHGDTEARSSHSVNNRFASSPHRFIASSLHRLIPSSLNYHRQGAKARWVNVQLQYVFLTTEAQRHGVSRSASYSSFYPQMHTNLR